VGIAPVMAATSMKERPYAVWLPIDKESPELTVIIRTVQRAQIVLPAICQTMSKVDRNLPLVDVVTMEEQIAKGLQRERMFATLCTGFGGLALVLSVVGLYGVIAYSTSRGGARSASASAEGIVAHAVGKASKELTVRPYKSVRYAAGLRSMGTSS
jgi:hypothetical protein